MSKSKINILFVLPSLKAGGAERVISFIASNLNPNKFTCTLIVVGQKKDAIYNTEGIEVLFLNKRRVLNAIPKLFKHILIKNPDIVVGSIAHVNRVLAMLSIFFFNTKFIGREASVLSIMNSFNTKKSVFHFPFFKNYHKYLDAVICQSIDMANDLISNNLFSKEKIHIINNPISGYLPIKSSKPITTVKEFITIGRLSKEKGHLRILEAISKLSFEYNYTIIGTGDEKDAIIQHAKHLGIIDNIKIIPHTNTVAQYLSNSDIFIQGSYVEGFPNALLESCVVGTPVIAFNAPGGTKEIIEESINGYIVENTTQFIETLNMMVQKDWDPKRINASVTKKYNKELILEKYEALFNSLSSKSKP